MLRVILEFNDVIRIVVATHQLGLRPAPHPPDMLDRQPHGAMLASEGPRSKRIVPLREGFLAGSNFPELPADLAKDFTNRGWRIHQVKCVPERHTFNRAKFATSGQDAWAARCLQKNTSILVVKRMGATRNPAPLAPLDEPTPPSKNGDSRLLGIVDEKWIRSPYGVSAPETDRRPKVPDQDAIEDGLVEKGSKFTI
jgi:hypothetical protein